MFGLGRSGTTFIHRLLSLDPICRAPLLWEMLYPVPSLHCPSISQTDLNADRDLRAEFVKQRIQSRNQMGDQTMENLHEVGFDLPEECLFNLSDELPFSFHYLCTILRRFSAFLRHTPSSRILAAYESHKRILQLLAFQTGERGHGGRRWMLKCPLHIWFLREIHQVFPDAKFVWYVWSPQRLSLRIAYTFTFATIPVLTIYQGASMSIAHSIFGLFISRGDAPSVLRTEQL